MGSIEKESPMFSVTKIGKICCCVDAIHPPSSIAAVGVNELNVNWNSSLKEMSGVELSRNEAMLGFQCSCR